jgi:hypothetical protein
MFTMGTGIVDLRPPARRRHNGTFSTAAAARATSARHAQNCVRAQIRFIVGPVEGDQALIDGGLIPRIHAFEGGRDSPLHVVDRCAHAFAGESREDLHPAAQRLHAFPWTLRRNLRINPKRRHRVRPRTDERRIAARVQNLPSARLRYTFIASGKTSATDFGRLKDQIPSEASHLVPQLWVAKVLGGRLAVDSGEQQPAQVLQGRLSLIQEESGIPDTNSPPEPGRCFRDTIALHCGRQNDFSRR